MVNLLIKLMSNFVKAIFFHYLKMQSNAKRKNLNNVSIFDISDIGLASIFKIMINYLTTYKNISSEIVIFTYKNKFQL